MKKLLFICACLFSFFSFGSPQTSFAGDQATLSHPTGIIPAADKKEDCATGTSLGTKIYCGTFELKDITVLIVYFINYVTWIAGGISVFFIVIGGYQYAIAGITDDKEKGKKTLIYAIAGLAVTFFAWIGVDLIQNWLTSMTEL